MIFSAQRTETKKSPQRQLCSDLFLSWYMNTGVQRLYQKLDSGGHMGMRPVKGSQHPAADHTAVFVVCLWQHDNVLGNAALGDGISPPQIGAQNTSQLLHNAAQASLA